MKTEEMHFNFNMDDRQLDALYAAWHDDRKQPTPTSLREWIERFPAYRQHLIEWTTDAPCLDGADALSLHAAAEARTLAIGRQILADRLARRNEQSAIEITSLYALAQQQGLNPKSLAAALEVGVPIVAKLQQRLLRYQSIPAQFVERLAQTLQVSREQLRDYLTRPPSLASAAMYRSSVVPQAGAQEDFAAAIRSCPGMTPEQKSKWSVVSGQGKTVASG